VLVVDANGRKILQNRRFNELMRIPVEVADNPDDAVQRQVVATIVRDPDEFQAKVDELNSHPDQISRDELGLLSGTLLERYSAPVRDKAGNYYGRIWTFRDVTERRRLEESLRQAQKMEALGQLSGGIAHDFNNLLTVILGCSEAIGEQVSGDKKLAKMAEMIVGAARRGADLTQHMLAFARRQNLQPQPVDIDQLLKETEGFLRRALSAEIDLELIPSASSCVATVDPAQLDNALLNLCVNSRDAMSGGGKLTIAARRTSLDEEYAAQNADVQPGEYVQISVTDTGSGISPEHVGRVFDPFFTTKEVGKGTGLGLSMVYGFVKQSRGHVRIYSELGHGTTVNLYLPATDGPAIPIETREVSGAELGGTETILLVEDEYSVREFAKAQLESLGYHVLDAAFGAEALRLLQDHAEIDLLFTDVVMPGGISGGQLAREACRLRPGLKVLFSSGYAESSILHHGMLDRGADLLNKPYSRLDLARRIHKALASGKPDAARSR
jgi:signal transduction histidine kinase